MQHEQPTAFLLYGVVLELLLFLFIADFDSCNLNLVGRLLVQDRFYFVRVFFGGFSVSSVWRNFEAWRRFGGRSMSPPDFRIRPALMRSWICVGLSRFFGPVIYLFSGVLTVGL